MPTFLTDIDIMSPGFYAVLAAAALLYYVIPKAYRWLVLLCATLFFVVQLNTLESAGVLIGITLVAYLAGLAMNKFAENQKAKKAVLAASVIAIVATLFAFKEQIFFVNTGNWLLSQTGQEPNLTVYPLLAPLGISYVSLTLISYICEAYWGTLEIQKNPLKFVTFGLYFPVLSSGPVLKYKEVEAEILEGKSFDYDTFCFGLQRMCWGFFKKLVISERLAVLVNTIYADYEFYDGFYVVIAACAFSMQLYTDFSGCIDIMLGASELLGIKLPENFDLPFSSRTLAEFWRRWHITLGRWLKEYVLYPILKSAPFQAIGEAAKKAFGKKKGKKVPTWCALVISWFLIGFWHGGGYNYIFGVGLYMGAVIILSEMLEPLWKKSKELLRINDKAFSWQLFQMARTFCIFTWGLSFFRAASLEEGFAMWSAFTRNFNPWILTDGSLYNLGLAEADLRLTAASIGAMALLGVIKMAKGESIRVLIARQNIVFRWSIYAALVCAVVFFGMYGYGYDAQAFIYQGF